MMQTAWPSNSTGDNLTKFCMSTVSLTCLIHALHIILLMKVETASKYLRNKGGGGNVGLRDASSLQQVLTSSV